MKRLLIPMLLLTAMSIEVCAQGDVPPIAQHEIARRGSHVEQTGTIRSGLMAAALSPPADDSAKWFVTLIVRPGDRSSATMLSTIANDPAMKPWVDAREPSKSTTHYQVRSIDDPTQADWLESLRPALARSGVPLVVLQPPKNGQFGPSSTVVKIISGVLSGDDLSKKLREGVIAYIQELQPRGISQSVMTSSAPPFAVPPQAQPQAPQVPFEFPPAPTPVQPAVNPTQPAADQPPSRLAVLVIGAAVFLVGWIAARVKTFAGAKLNAITTAIQDLNDLKKNASAPKSPTDE